MTLSEGQGHWAGNGNIDLQSDLPTIFTANLMGIALNSL